MHQQMQQQMQMMEAFNTMMIAIRTDRETVKLDSPDGNPIKDESKSAPSYKKYLDSRDFSDFVKFKGVENEFTEFKHKLMCAIGISSEYAKQEVEKASKADAARLCTGEFDLEQKKVSM
jgi:hypothetical protein